MIWEPFVLALVLGLVISAGLYVAYLWPAVDPADGEAPAQAPGAPAGPPPPAGASGDDASPAP